MPMSKAVIRVSLLGLAVAPALMLSACDDDWVAVPYHGVPYSHDRTAGSGVEWVRKSMLPPKEVDTTSVTTTTETKTVAAPAETVPPPPAPPQQMFDKKQSK